jgi:hypothetical protein
MECVGLIDSPTMAARHVREGAVGEMVGAIDRWRSSRVIDPLVVGKYANLPLHDARKVFPLFRPPVSYLLSPVSEVLSVVDSNEALALTTLTPTLSSLYNKAS